MTLTQFDYGLAAAVALFAILGLRSGMVAQIKLLFGLAMGVFIAAPLSEKLAPLVQPHAGLPLPTVRIAVFCALFIVFVLLGVAFFEKIRPSLDDLDQKIPAWDRLAGLLVGAGKSAFMLYAALSLAIVLVPTLEPVKTSAAAGFARQHPLLGSDLSPELAQLQKLAQDPNAAKQSLKDGVKGLIDEESKLPKPTAEHLALATALKNGDVASLMKGSKLTPLIQKTGIDKALIPEDPAARIKAGLEGPAAAPAPAPAAPAAADAQ